MAEPREIKLAKKRAYAKRQREIRRDELNTRKRELRQADVEGARRKDSQYRRVNRAKVLALKKACYHRNKDAHAARGRAWAKANATKLRSYQSGYRKANRQKITDRCRAWKASARLKDPMYRVKEAYRARLVCFVRASRMRKGFRSLSVLGCSWEEFKAHIERLFSAGMSWDNHGAWHIDHIIPLSSAKTIDDVRRLSHFSNLQPLWAADNISKGNRIKHHGNT